LKLQGRQVFVAAVIVLGLAWIFLPMLFGDRAAPPAPLPSRIPPPPVLPVLAEQNPSRPVILADAVVDENVDSTLEIPAPARRIEAPRDGQGEAGWRTLPVLDESGLPQGWSLRLGEYSDRQEAQRLLEQLLGEGYRAYIRQRSTEAGELDALFIGPWLARDLAEDEQQRLAEQFGISAAIVRYQMQGFAAC